MDVAKGTSLESLFKGEGGTKASSRPRGPMLKAGGQNQGSLRFNARNQMIAMQKKDTQEKPRMRMVEGRRRRIDFVVLATVFPLTVLEAITIYLTSQDIGSPSSSDLPHLVLFLPLFFSSFLFTQNQSPH